MQTRTGTQTQEPGRTIRGHGKADRPRKPQQHAPTERSNISNIPGPISKRPPERGTERNVLFHGNAHAVHQSHASSSTRLL